MPRQPDAVLVSTLAFLPALYHMPFGPVSAK